LTFLELKSNPIYIPPEISSAISNQNDKMSYDPFKNDVYNLGIICLQMITGIFDIAMLNSKKYFLNVHIIIDLQRLIEYDYYQQLKMFED